MQKAEIEGHLRTCPSCANDLSLFRQAISLVHELDETEPSAGFEDRVLGALDVQPARQPFWRLVPLLGDLPWERTWVRVGAGALLLIEGILMTVVVWALQPSLIPGWGAMLTRGLVGVTHLFSRAVTVLEVLRSVLQPWSVLLRALVITIGAIPPALVAAVLMTTLVLTGFWVKLLTPEDARRNHALSA